MRNAANSYPVVVDELLGPPEFDPMFGQGCVPLDAGAPDDVVPDDVVVDVLVVAANEANPYATSAPTAKTVMTAMSSNDFLLGNDLAFGSAVVPISIFSFHLRQTCRMSP